MSQTQTQQYDFHTGLNENNEPFCGIVFVPGTGQFYEFQNPETHDDYERLECPRTGDVITHTGKINKMMQEWAGGHITAAVNADKWAQFRETYLETDDMTHEQAKEHMKELTPDPPAETGVK